MRLYFAADIPVAIKRHDQDGLRDMLLADTDCSDFVEYIMTAEDAC
jgi:hypothetical protein